MRERERDRETETDRDRDRDRQTDRQRHRETESEAGRKRNRDRDSDSEREKQTFKSICLEDYHMFYALPSPPRKKQRKQNKHKYKIRCLPPVILCMLEARMKTDW